LFGKIVKDFVGGKNNQIAVLQFKLQIC